MKDLRREAHPHIDQRRVSRHGSSRHGAPKATAAREYIGTHRKSAPVSLALSRRSAAQLAARAPVTARRGVIKSAGVGSLHIVRKKEPGGQRHIQLWVGRLAERQGVRADKDCVGSRTLRRRSCSEDRKPHSGSWLTPRTRTRKAVEVPRFVDV